MVRRTRWRDELAVMHVRRRRLEMVMLVQAHRVRMLLRLLHLLQLDAAQRLAVVQVVETAAVVQRQVRAANTVPGIRPIPFEFNSTQTVKTLEKGWIVNNDYR